MALHIGVKLVGVFTGSCSINSELTELEGGNKESDGDFEV
jgi:hypothetical protein